jgi:hypothetical protein
MFVLIRILSSRIETKGVHFILEIGLQLLVFCVSVFTECVLKYVLKEGSPIQLSTLRDSLNGQLERKTLSKFCYEL